MYKFIVVTDPEIASGFRLAGAEVIEAADAQEAKKVIPPLLHRDDIGIVAVNEDFIQVLEEKLMNRIERAYRPIVIPIPKRARTGGGPGYLENLLRRAVGYNIVVRR